MRFGFADENHIRVRLSFFRQKSDVRPTHRHRDSALAEASREFIGVCRAGRVEGDRYQVCICAEIDRFDRFVRVKHGPMGRRERRQIRHGDLLEVQNAGPTHA